MASLDLVTAGMSRLLTDIGAKRTKLIVGVDYGTTFSGIAFVHSTKSDFKDIKPYTAWPGGPLENNDHLAKAPSQYAYASENQDLAENAWGYEVQPGMTSYSWTKLLLDKNALKSESDDPGLQQAIAEGMMRLPRGKEAKDVVTDYLRGIYQMFMSAIIKTLGGSDILEITPMEFWLTVPAIWSDEAKSVTRAAAKAAGFGSRPGDEVNLITEPEAAAHLALKSSIHHTSDLVMQGTGVMVCDCGGGTVDITSYTVKRTEPRLILEESGWAGGKCGGTYIDRNLHKLLAQRFGRAFTSLPPERIGPGSRFMNEFESKKRNFGDNRGGSGRPIRLQLIIPELAESRNHVSGYDKRYAEVILSQQDMKVCFDPVLEKIMGLVDGQIATVRRAGKPGIKTIILVGGLGASPYLYERAKVYCAQNNMRLVTPWSGAWSAVVCGAVLRGLEGSLVNKYIARRWYGQSISRKHRPGIDSTTDSYWISRWKDVFTGETMIRGFVSWEISKGTEFDETSEVPAPLCYYWTEGSVKQMEWDLWSCSLDQAPEKHDHERVEKVGRITANFDGLDLDACESRRDDNQRKVYKVDVNVLIKLGARQGTLAFRTMAQGREVGGASIEFSHT